MISPDQYPSRCLSHSPQIVTISHKPACPTTSQKQIRLFCIRCLSTSRHTCLHRPSDVCCVQHRQTPTPGDLQACPKLLYCEFMAGWRGVPHPGLSNPQQAVLWHAWTRSMARSGPWRQSTTATRPHCHNDSGQTPPVNYFSRLQIIVLSVQHLPL